MKMAYLSWPPLNMNSIEEVCNSLRNDSLMILLSEITGLLADFGRMTSYHLRSREGLPATLCLHSTQLKCKLQKSVWEIDLDKINFIFCH